MALASCIFVPDVLSISVGVFRHAKSPNRLLFLQDRRVPHNAPVGGSVCAGRGNWHDAAVAVPPPQPAEAPVQPDRLVAIGLAVALAATLLALKRSLDKLGAASASQQSPGPGSAFAAAMEATNNPDGREYRMALARTRQAVAVHRAIGFLNAANTARAMVELRRALHENSVCRAPLINAKLGQTELQTLYRVHLENAPVPADFATLLQLRAMLDLDFEVAERIEREVMEQGAAYSI